jgi:uncharacterized heparinase superfamily protein
MFKTVLLLLHTLKYLKPKQFVYRFYYLFVSVKVKSLTDYTQANLDVNRLEWKGMPFLSQTVFSDGTACFLNRRESIVTKGCWNDNSKEKLWIYNLHYMDELSSINGEQRIAFQKSHILRWIAENPAALGNGWEPYTLSLRLVNLVKWCWLNKVDDREIIASIAQQTDLLSKKIEYHILANHLFANGKALVFVGCFFKGQLGKKYLTLGLKILAKEVDEQFLEDGGHFELSPMYHSVMLWDLLELIELSNLDPSLFGYKKFWSEVAEKGLNWLQAMCHPDGQISFFNDAAIGISASPKVIFDYALRHGLHMPSSLSDITQLVNSGFTCVSNKQVRLIFNHADIGPTYQPGHAHADTLSFELSIEGHRLFVNSGTSCYGVSSQRNYERQTKSHNTVVVNDGNSSEIWGGFRVARRANVSGVICERKEEGVTLRACHDGYSRLVKGLLHRRKITVSENAVLITDSVNLPAQNATAYYYLHPDIQVSKISTKEIVLITPSGIRIVVASSNFVSVNQAQWHPGFGLSSVNYVLSVDFEICQELVLEWSACEK